MALGEADLIVGTSVGAIVGAVLATGQGAGRFASPVRSGHALPPRSLQRSEERTALFLAQVIDHHLVTVRKGTGALQQLRDRQLKALGTTRGAVVDWLARHLVHHGSRRRAIANRRPGAESGQLDPSRGTSTGGMSRRSLIVFCPHLVR